MGEKNIKNPGPIIALLSILSKLNLMIIRIGIEFDPKKEKF